MVADQRAHLDGTMLVEAGMEALLSFLRVSMIRLDRLLAKSSLSSQEEDDNLNHLQALDWHLGCTA